VTAGETLLCGRVNTALADPGEAATSPETIGRAACEHARECIRRDVVDDPFQQVRADRLRASAILFDACRSTAVGGRLGTDVSLSLDALDSTAVAVAGCSSIRQGPPTTPAYFVALLSAGMPVGAVVDCLNKMEDNGSIGQFTLLGDAARTWPGQGWAGKLSVERDTASLVLTGATALKVHTRPEVKNLSVDSAKTHLLTAQAGPGEWWLVHPEAVPITGEFAVAQSEVNYGAVLSQAIYPTLDALAQWDGHGLQVPVERVADLRRQARELAREACLLIGRRAIKMADDRLRTLMGLVLEVQSEMLKNWVDRVHHGSDRYTEQWPEPVVYGPRRKLACWQCGGPAERRPAVAGFDEGIRLFLVVCPDCGETAAGSDDVAWEAVLEGPVRAARGDEIDVSWGVRGVAGPALVSLGLAVLYSRSNGIVLAGRHDEIIDDPAVMPTDIALETVGTIGPTALADSHTLRMIAVVNGRQMVLSRTLWVGRRGFGDEWF
jgi:hypothetical protein